MVEPSGGFPTHRCVCVWSLFCEIKVEKERSKKRERKLLKSFVERETDSLKHLQKKKHVKIKGFPPVVVKWDLRSKAFMNNLFY